MERELQLKNEIQENESDIRKLKLRISHIKSKLLNPNSVCSKLQSCDSCTANPLCGWCSMTQACVEEDEKGPLSGSCTFYDFKTCPGSKECNSYKHCNSCIQDIACGWCNDFTKFPTCMDKNDADKGNCRNDKFIHQWNSQNSCPMVNQANFKDYVIEQLKKPESEDELIPKKNNVLLAINPEEKTKMENELKIYEGEQIKNEILLDENVSQLKKLMNN